MEPHDGSGAAASVGGASGPDHGMLEMLVPSGADANRGKCRAGLRDFGLAGGQLRRRIFCAAENFRRWFTVAGVRAVVAMHFAAGVAGAIQPLSAGAPADAVLRIAAAAVARPGRTRTGGE